LLAAWVDRRDRAVYATRVSREPRVLDPQGIRFVPPRQPYTSYETPQAAAVPGGWALVFTRRINEHYGEPDVMLVRIAPDGALVDREPRVLLAGAVAMIASNGGTTLVTYHTADGQLRGQLFDRAFEPIAAVTLRPRPDSRVGAATPCRGGYLVTLVREGDYVSREAFVVRVADDGRTGEETPIGAAMMVAATATPGGALIVK